MRQLYNLLYFPSTLIHAVQALRRQRKFVRKQIDPILSETPFTYLSDRDIKKIRKYYSLAVPAILGEGFCLLRGKPMSRSERFTLTYLGALSGLYDDFFDQHDTPEAHIRELTIHPSERIARNERELLFIRFYKMALEHSSQPQLIKEGFQEIRKAQLLSKRQKERDIGAKDIRYITLFKGGVSFLFYRSGLDGKIAETEEEVIYSLGGLMQLENDIFDIYKDHQDNISTLATITHSINDLRTKYKQLHWETLDLLSKTSFSRSQKLSFLRYINLIIHRGSVCLDCLEENESLTGGVFTIEKYERKQLICDMEKAGNLFRVFRYYIISEIPK